MLIVFVFSFDDVDFLFILQYVSCRSFRFHESVLCEESWMDREHSCEFSSLWCIWAIVEKVLITCLICNGIQNYIFVFIKGMEWSVFYSIRQGAVLPSFYYIILFIKTVSTTTIYTPLILHSDMCNLFWNPHLC